MRYKITMKPLRRPWIARAGFSLIELLVVLVLMIILTTMMWGFASARHQKTQKELCCDNLQKIYLALQIYANDFGGKLPQDTNAQTSEPVLSVLVPKYTADTSIFICPGGRDRQIPAGEPFAQRKISYAYYMGERLTGSLEALMSDRQVDTEPKHTNDLVFSETGAPPGNNHSKYGGNFLFSDGSAQSTGPHLAFPLTIEPGAVLLNPKP